MTDDEQVTISDASKQKRRSGSDRICKNKEEEDKDSGERRYSHHGDVIQLAWFLKAEVEGSGFILYVNMRQCLVSPESPELNLLLFSC